MPSTVAHLSQKIHSFAGNIWKASKKNLNFYRTHLLFFTFTPLIFSGIFYASNGRYHISYIDALFNCVSAMTVCGLATINLSSLTGFQQALLFVLMCIGNPVIVSWVIVYMRRYFFARKFEDMLEAAAMRKAASIVEEAETRRKPWPHRFFAYLKGDHIELQDEDKPEVKEKKKRNGVLQKLRPDMIRRMDDAPKLVNPSGWVSENRPPSVKGIEITNIHLSPKPSASPVESRSSTEEDAAAPKPTTPPPAELELIPSIPTPRSSSAGNGHRRRRLSDPGAASRPSSPIQASPPGMHRFETVTFAGPATPPRIPKSFPRTQTIEFAPDPLRSYVPDPMRRRGRSGFSHTGIPEALPEEMDAPESRPRRRSAFSHTSIQEPLNRPPTMEHRSSYGRTSVPMARHGTTHTTSSFRSMQPSVPATTMTQGYGGFPTPFELLRRLLDKLSPKLNTRLTRSLTIPATVSLTPSRAGTAQGKKHAPYISFDAIVGRNSSFHMLTQEQMDELGGVEYRALNALLWIVGTYHIAIQLMCFTIIAPYMSISKWKPVFDSQIRPLNHVWFSAFQVVSAYTNTGTSLVDQSMVPFQKAYAMIFPIIFLILAGNTAFPVFLRFGIWCLTKVVPIGSRIHETLHFLLDHPRRCFIYLFPSHQTWFLLTIVLGLTAIDWFFFLVLDIHNPSIAAIPTGVRVLDGLLQATAVRAAGFGVVALADLAPAVKVLYVVMMYISVYPIAMSVRSTNVYEERSLGLFNPHDQDSDDSEETFVPSGDRMTVWSRYLAMHARQQLAFDMWWLALSLFLICIIEKNNLENPDTLSWFNIFRIIFELVSAYGTVGLSLGIPDQNYSFSGAFHPLSKLIICLVMLRGRHRGLPVAIDRAIMLPMEFQDANVGMNFPEGDDNSPPDVEGSSTAYSRNKLGRASSRASRRSRMSRQMSRQSDDFDASELEHHHFRHGPQHVTEEVNNTDVTFDIQPIKR